MFEEVCGNKKVGFNTSVFLSEKEHADNNYALAYSMRGAGAFGKPTPSTSKINRMLDLYFQICLFLLKYILYYLYCSLNYIYILFLYL